MSVSNRLYLPNLNALRAFAALIVIISHIERKIGSFGLQINKSVISWGPIGVTLFFVLSGFLITYLLLIEKDKFIKVNIKDFYFRRILRIWPLYFLILVFVYVCIPYLLPGYYIGEKDRFTLKSILLNAFFLTNVTMIIKLTPLIINSIWSIGVEEQFYIFWPWVIKSKKYITIIILIIFLTPLVKILLLVSKELLELNALKTIYDILNLTRFDSMAVGGFFGVLAFYKVIKIKNFKLKYEMFTNERAQYIIYSLLFIIFVISQIFPKLINVINFQVLPFLFAICILNLATNPKTIFNIEGRMMNYLGKISYSLYLNHIIVIYLFNPFLETLILDFSTIEIRLIVYISTLVLVILISYITYNFYEKKFLKFKKNFSHIRT